MVEETQEAEAAKESEGTSQVEGENPEGSAEEGNKKKKIIILGAAIVAILLIIPVTLHFTGVFPLFGDKKHAEDGDNKGDNAKKDGKTKGKKKADNIPPPPVIFELDEFLVNLSTPGKQARFLKLTVVLELPSEEEKKQIEPYVPRIRDSFQLYLRELREEDVKGSAAIYRLREELMLRLSKVVYPIKVNDILFKEILTQ